jgi:diaminopimelate epimerase
MKLPFTKMQCAGNDFVVVDATRQKVELTSLQWRWLVSPAVRRSGRTRS